MRPALLLIALALVSALRASAANPTVSYTALSDAARKAGRLDRYAGCAVVTNALQLGDYSLRFAVPKAARAYDVIPISYTLTQPAGARRAAVEAVAFEDSRRAGDKPLYDLAIPGDMNVKVEYLDSVRATLDETKYIPLTADPKTPISPFPPYNRDRMVRSGMIRASQVAWFRFRVTNTGDTILDPEGFGAAFAEPRLIKLDKNGKEEWSSGTINIYERFLNYLYPGDSAEFWVNFFSPKSKLARGIDEGDYRIDFRMLYRYHREYNWWANIWSGAEFARLEVPIKVTAEGGRAPVNPVFKMTDAQEKMPGYFDTFEEFMTSFRIYPGVEKPVEQTGTIYLQVAPWTRHATIKLILTDPRQIAVARVPIKITDETLAIKYNPKNVMVVKGEDGVEKPAIIAQAMPAMRIGFQLGPYPERHMLERLAEMKSLGVNVISNTSGGWWIGEVSGRKGVELHSACYKYFYDVLMRKLGMKVLGWSVYPPSGTEWYSCAEPLLGREVTYSMADGGYTGAGKQVDLGDPIVPKVIAAWAIYNHVRWGDYWFTTKDGRVPVDIEDTWGWMRDDINLRYQLGPLALQRFRDWAKAKYGDIDKVNAAWASRYKDFSEIDPQANQGIEGDGLTNGPVYNNPANPFHDWSPAVDDWDRFRTLLRMDIYRKANELMRKRIPGAELALRTEGANLTIKGDPKSESMHFRHVYFSQRRNAMVQDVVDRANVLHFHSDYTTLPYTEDEWRQGMREMVANGIIPAFLIQADHMRDILLQPHYGRQYQMSYNLDQPSKGMMVHCLMAAYPWWKATYEEGGAPGIIWNDYLCDGFATETQKREVKLLSEHFGKMRK